MKVAIARLVFVLFSLSIANAWADGTRRDGNWWGSQTRASKTDYLVGFFDGMDLGANFARWGFIHSDNASGKKQDFKGFTAASESYQKYSEKYFTNVTNVQLSDGLDAFYSDFKNRGIKVNLAVWLVVQEINGEPPSESTLNNWRKSGTF